MLKEDEKLTAEEKKRIAAYKRRKKADNKWKNSGLKMKKIQLHQETLNGLKSIAEKRRFHFSSEELGYDDISLLITMLVDWELGDGSFDVTDHETVVLKRLHLTAKYCMKDNDERKAMDITEIQKLFEDCDYSLRKDTIQRLLRREVSETDLNWSPDVIRALLDEEQVKTVIVEIGYYWN
ncbi:TPA: hypothetical protein ACN311_002379 [Vibrio parahaemolyticus]|nr:hypothetical protein [Vibrio vulnificus]